MTSEEVSFTWSVPEDNGSPILDYSVEMYNETTKNFAEIASNLNQTSYSESGLTENTTYKFRLRARNEIGFGNYSSEISVSTLIGDIGRFHSYIDDSVVVNNSSLFSSSGYIDVNGTYVNEKLS